jgi:hypothetical protein
MRDGCRVLAVVLIGALLPQLAGASDSDAESLAVPIVIYTVPAIADSVTTKIGMDRGAIEGGVTAGGLGASPGFMQTQAGRAAVNLAAVSVLTIIDHKANKRERWILRGIYLAVRGCMVWNNVRVIHQLGDDRARR